MAKADRAIFVEALCHKEPLRQHAWNVEVIGRQGRNTFGDHLLPCLEQDSRYLLPRIGEVNEARPAVGDMSSSFHQLFVLEPIDQSHRSGMRKPDPASQYADRQSGFHID